MQNKTKVLMVHRLFASYRRPIYDKLADEYQVMLVHGKSDTSINQAATDYSKVVKVFQYTKNPTHLAIESFSSFFKFKPKVVIHEFAIGIASLVPMYLCSKLMRTKFILYSHGYNRLHGFNPNENRADKFRVFLMKAADAVVLYTQTDKKRLSAHIDNRKIFVAQNTLDTTQLVALKNSLEQETKAQVKERLGFTYPYNLTFIGRLLDEKLPEKVLEVFDILNKKLPNQIGIHFVGGGGEMAALQRTVNEKQWQNQVKFYGSVYDDQKTGAFLFASDMMIIPGCLGLAINHAFIFDCPVISFLQMKEGPFHGPEIEYVVENKTGFLIPDGSVPKMADKICAYLQDDTLQAQVKSHIQQKMKTELTIDNMVKGFTEAVSFVMNGRES